ncbi:hypothetical protein [Agrilutibacter solisilvae]|uniref:Lipoprotein n=1 Tax=Agrilutibacter solisilvae TaxID=2763317 RepID=A0A974Y184_9GAMM|nr:hypothetical protein [Lysobacter solisilvae]QSX79378.1 hypothetical protein I8J32_005820 [Lysobacter solisilvae]
MLINLLRALLLILASWPSLSMASSCTFGEVTDEAFSSAKYIFVFRVLGTEIREGNSTPVGAEPGFGRLRVVENFRGRAPYEGFTFSAHRGCGSKLVPGHYYVGVSSSSKGEFVAGPATVLDLGSEYREGIDNAHAFVTFSNIASAATGMAKLSVVLPPGDRMPIEYFPLPPPPPEDP